jgi:hypothetical protein
VRIRNEVPSTKRGTARERPEARDCNPGSGESGQESRPKREAAQKAMDALKKGGRSQQKIEPGMEGILIMDYWMVLPIIVMVVTSLIMRVQRHLGETWRPGDDGPILAKVGGANLPIDRGGTGSNNRN